MLEIRVNSIRPDVKTRAQRRDAICIVRRVLTSIRSAELEYIVNAPRNFSSSPNYLIGQKAVEYIGEALHSLESAYDKNLAPTPSYGIYSIDEPF